MVIGYTSGVFDLFHMGHLKLLKNAKGMCDRLIVGVTTDELVAYKNKKAVIPFEERMEVVRSCKYVDAVIPQENMDKLTICKKLKADIMFVGDDWYDTEKWNDYETKFQEAGIEIIYFPYTKGTSSTLLNSALNSLRLKDDNILQSDYFGLTNIFVRDECCARDIKFLLEKGKISDFSPEGISSFFSFRYPIREYTMFSNIKKLDTAVVKDNEKEETYWRPLFKEKNISLAEAEIVCESLLVKSLKKLVENKKRIGVTLSGGIDSSLIAAMVKKHFPDKEIYSYSVGFYGDDEFEYSRLVADKFSDKHCELLLGKEDFIGENSIMPSLIKYKGAPLHPNELGLALAERQARKDCCDIVLCGEGADDIFGGYGRNLRMYLEYDGANYTNFLMDHYRYISREHVNKLIKSQYVVDDIELLEPIFKEEACPSDLKNRMLYFIQRVHTRGLIERGNNALSYNGFPQGFPFIDIELVEYVNNLPFDYKVHWNSSAAEMEAKGKTSGEVSEIYDTTKYLLKKIAEKYLPETIIYRKKYGFPVPFEAWLGEIKTWDLNQRVFKTKDISFLSGWEKFMVINLNEFLNIFDSYLG